MGEQVGGTEKIAADDVGDCLHFSRRSENLAPQKSAGMSAAAAEWTQTRREQGRELPRRRFRRCMVGIRETAAEKRKC